MLMLMLMLMLIYDPRQKHQELHTSERTIVPRAVIFNIYLLSHFCHRFHRFHRFFLYYQNNFHHCASAGSDADAQKSAIGTVCTGITIAARSFHSYFFGLLFASSHGDTDCQTCFVSAPHLQQKLPTEITSRLLTCRCWIG